MATLDISLRSIRPMALVVVGALAVIGLLLGSCFVTTVPPGHNKVATLFGEVQDQPYAEGLHIVRVIERQEAHVIPFADAQITIKDRIRGDRRSFAARSPLERRCWASPRLPRTGAR